MFAIRCISAIILSRTGWGGRHGSNMASAAEDCLDLLSLLRKGRAELGKTLSSICSPSLVRSALHQQPTDLDMTSPSCQLKRCLLSNSLCGVTVIHRSFGLNQQMYTSRQATSSAVEQWSCQSFRGNVSRAEHLAQCHFNLCIFLCFLQQSQYLQARRASAACSLTTCLPWILSRCCCSQRLALALFSPLCLQLLISLLVCSSPLYLCPLPM